MTWKDQPAERVNATLVIPVRIYTKTHAGHIAELWRTKRGGEWEWYVTVGNLFGSTTVKCRTIEAASEIIRLVNIGRVSWRDLPMGTEAMRDFETVEQYQAKIVDPPPQPLA